MLDIWSFLLQTLTSSGAAALILFIKALFKDKLSPKWQFAVWSVLGIVILYPAGLSGRYALFRWQFIVEIIKSEFGIYTFTRVLFPIPIITSMPSTIADWLFVIYVLGVFLTLINYLVSYFRLMRVLKRGNTPCDDKLLHISEIAASQRVKLRRVIEVKGITSAFVCGVVRPVLVIPSDQEINNKIILHEFFHLKNRDTLWSMVICALRCLHWCNPLIVYCANRAINDMESRCDQNVLEQLEGEQRREYGHILLSMANERFSKTPGSTCINNGGRNIRGRIENIARFKKYPKGMGLVSVCVIMLLAFSLVTGVHASAIYEIDKSVDLTLASARSIPCTTPAGAFDTYAKAVLTQNGYYRAMCAPEDIQKDILNEMSIKSNEHIYPMWDSGIVEFVNEQDGYYIYNLKQIDDNTYEGFLVIELSYPPDGMEAQINMMYLAYQKLRVEKVSGRWVCIPLEDFKYDEVIRDSLIWDCRSSPGITYSGIASGFEIKTTLKTIHVVNNTVYQNNSFGLFSSTYYDTVPKPNAEFTQAEEFRTTKCYYIGDDADKAHITSIGLSTLPIYDGDEYPQSLKIPTGNDSISSSSTGEQCVSMSLKPTDKQLTDAGVNKDWNSPIELSGSRRSIDPNKTLCPPGYYAADFYINNQKVAHLNLILQEGE